MSRPTHSPVAAPAAAFSPILARTSTVHARTEPVAYDCVKLIFVRSGSAIVFSEFGQTPVNVGDVVVLGSNTRCGSAPGAHHGDDDLRSEQLTRIGRVDQVVTTLRNDEALVKVFSHQGFLSG